MMLSTTVGAAFEDSSSVRTHACCRCPPFVGSIAVSYGLNPLLLASNRDCGQFARTGALALALTTGLAINSSRSGGNVPTALISLTMPGRASYMAAIGFANGSA